MDVVMDLGAEGKAWCYSARLHDEAGELFTACRLNVGVHWGAALFIGQLTTSGRLEVTALGDEVDECARIEQSARGGQVLASKAIVERLTDEDAHALGLAPERLTYRMVAELPGAGEKATRDAGAIAVVDLGEAQRQGAPTYTP